MKHFLKPALVFTTAILLVSCGENQSNQETTATDSFQTTPVTKTEVIPETEPEVHDTTAVKILTKDILTSIKNHEYESIADHFHPDLGVRFSPYAFIDTEKNIQLSAKEYKEGITSNKEFTWGNFDGSGDPIHLSIPEYFKKFVYSSDFLNAEKKAVNKMIGSGNSLNNLNKIYPEAVFTESYDPGKHVMAWKTLRLIYKKEGGKFYLIGIVHDQWTM